MNNKKLLFADIAGRGIMAGISLEAIMNDSRMVFGEVDPQEIILLPKAQVPYKYYWSARSLEEDSRTLNTTGTYLLIRDYEQTRGFRKHHPRLAKELTEMN